MYDGLQLFLRDSELSNQLRSKLPGLVARVSAETGEVLHLSTKYHDFYIWIYENGGYGVKMRGSLHKYSSGVGRNDTLFTLEQTRIAVDDFCLEFGIDQDVPCLQRLECGVNLECKCPEAIIDAAVMFNGRVASIRNITRKSYFKAWEFEDYTVKLYRKGASLLRFEVHIDRLRKISEVPIRSLSDLKNADIFVMCLRRLLLFGEQFLFVPGKIASLPTDLLGSWSAWRDDNFWNGLKPYQKTREKHKVEDAIDRYDLIDWKSYLRKGIMAQGAAMLDIGVRDLDAMISKLGSTTETVAGPIGNCDRQTDLIQDDLASKPFSCICLILPVRNEGLRHLPEVVRVFNDVHLGGRGPPVKDTTFCCDCKYVGIKQGPLLGIDPFLPPSKDEVRIVRSPVSRRI